MKSYFVALASPILKSVWFNDNYKKWSAITGSFDTNKYSSPLNPLKLINAKTDEIKCFSGRVLNRDGQVSRFQWGGVHSGSWDNPSNPGRKTLPTVKFEDYHLYRSFKDFFVDGKKWEETITYEIAIENIEKKGEYWHGCRSREDILARFEYCESLYESIKSEGYKKQHGIGANHPLTNLKKEIIVDISRSGELLFVDGRHRLAIVKLLGIGEVPVAVSVRHQEWMEYRDRVYASGLCEKRHPDFDEFSYTQSITSG